MTRPAWIRERASPNLSDVSIAALARIWVGGLRGANERKHAETS